MPPAPQGGEGERGCEKLFIGVFIAVVVGLMVAVTLVVVVSVALMVGIMVVIVVGVLFGVVMVLLKFGQHLHLTLKSNLYLNSQKK